MQLQTPSLAARGYAIAAEVLRKPHPVLQSSGYSKLASADPAQCASDLRHLQDRRLLQPLFSELQSLSGKSFTLDAAANDCGDNAHCSSFCSPSRSFLNELHSGHIWVNAPFTLLPEFVQHYFQCKQASPSTTACIVVPGFLLPVMRPFLKGMHILKTHHKGSTLFDAPTASGKRRAMAGTHWPVHVFTEAVLPTHIPPVAGQKCHPLHKAIVHQPSAVPSVPVAVSNQPLTMLFEGHLEQQDALTLLDSGASANFISKKALDIGKLTLNPTEATLELADGSSSPILGTAELTLHIGAFRTRVSCFVTELSIDFDIVLGNTFLTEYKAMLNYHLDTCTLVQHDKAYTLRPLSYSGADFDSPHCTHTLRLPPAPVAASARLPVEKLLLDASQCKRAIRQGCETFIVMVNTAVVPHTDVPTGSASVTSDNTCPCAASASAHCDAPASAAAPDTAFTLTQQIDGIKSQFADMFADMFAEPSGLPPDRGIEHVIPLEPDAQPPFKRMYCLSPSELIEVKRQVTELLQKQLIERSVSPYGGPLLFVLQKGGELRMVIDYRALNKLTIKKSFPFTSG